MQSGHRLQFHCHQCHAPILFSVLDRRNFDQQVVCSECGQRYLFDDDTLVNHLKQFESLCCQIHASEEILGQAAIAVNVGLHQVKVPFNILLTRLSSIIELNIGGNVTQIAFRIEPLVDVPAALVPS